MRLSATGRRQWIEVSMGSVLPMGGGYPRVAQDQRKLRACSFVQFLWPME